MQFEQPEHHEMILEKIHETGAEEWYCPQCGRRFLMQWPPEYEKVILEAGNENAIHHGGQKRTSAQLNEEAQPEVISSDDHWLEPWVVWMEKVNFESLWNQ